MARPDEWRDTLVARLDARWGQIQEFDNAYEGNLPLSYATRKFAEAYGGLFNALADNWMKIVVDASVERLRVQGFRFGSDQDADDEAWSIWQANGLDAQANMLHTEAVKLCEAYWLVQPPAPGSNDPPRITAEHPSQFIVATNPADRRQRLAACKKWAEDDDIFANVYLPDRVVKYHTTRRGLSIPDLPASPRWRTIGAVGNSLGVVPGVPAPNNPSMIHGGRSDLAGGPVSIQKGIDKLCADMLVGSEYTAFRQRVLLGVDQPRGADGKPLSMEQTQTAALQNRLWLFPGKDAKAFEFSASDLNNFRQAIDGLVRDLTAQTRTPPHYVSGQIVNASGDALKAAETGLISKVRDKMDPFGEAHEEAMRLAFLSIDKDDPRAQATDAETIWVDPESRSQAETVDAAVKMAAIGIPQEALWERIGASPQEIDRWKAMQEAEQLLTQAQETQRAALEAATQRRTANAEIDAREPTQPPGN